ncbi:MAG: hypothetical protein KAX49_11390 [Halanaerobiales bacterium]|nr:hypothetical protein [Halanaerobiales bacterium]
MSIYLRRIIILVCIYIMLFSTLIVQATENNINLDGIKELINLYETIELKEEVFFEAFTYHEGKNYLDQVRRGNLENKKYQKHIKINPQKVVAQELAYHI